MARAARPSQRASLQAQVAGHRGAAASRRWGSGGALPQTLGQKYRLIYLSVQHEPATQPDRPLPSPAVPTPTPPISGGTRRRIDPAHHLASHQIHVHTVPKTPGRVAIGIAPKGRPQIVPVGRSAGLPPPGLGPPPHQKEGLPPPPHPGPAASAPVPPPGRRGVGGVGP